MVLIFCQIVQSTDLHKHNSALSKTFRSNFAKANCIFVFKEL